MQCMHVCIMCICCLCHCEADAGTCVSVSVRLSVPAPQQSSAAPNLSVICDLRIPMTRAVLCLAYLLGTAIVHPTITEASHASVKPAIAIPDKVCACMCIAT